MYKIEFAREAEREIQKLSQYDKKLHERICDVLRDLSHNPFQGKKLTGRFKGRYSYRVGSYRIIYRIEKEKLIIVVLDFGHRRDIYR